jgi:hypothetical protein
VASRGERHPTELADLFGRRLVVASETSEGRRLNEALIKDLTGGEPVRARRMREDFWEFPPAHKVILLTNHKPRVRGTDEGIWRRPRLEPFGVCFWNPADPNNHGKGLPESLKQDKRLPDKLRAEYPGILAWLVRGCLDWQRDGLALPDAVRVATQEYREGEDLVAQWLEEGCLTGDSYRAKATPLYESFRRWCEANGEDAPKQKGFGDELTRRGYRRDRSNGIWYVGVAVRPSESARPTDDSTERWNGGTNFPGESQNPRALGAEPGIFIPSFHRSNLRRPEAVMVKSQTVRYEVRQIVLTDDYQAVYADCEQADGSVTLYARPVQALGVADEITRRFEDMRAVGRPEVHPGQVVGLVLAEGWFEVVNEYANFAGLCRKGGDINAATGCLRGELLSRLKRPEVAGG